MRGCRAAAALSEPKALPDGAAPVKEAFSPAGRIFPCGKKYPQRKVPHKAKSFRAGNAIRANHTQKSARMRRKESQSSMANENSRQPNSKSNRAKREARARKEKPVLIVLSIVLIVLLCSVALILFSLIADRNRTHTPDGKETGTSENATGNPSSGSENESHGGQTATYDFFPMDLAKDKEGPLVLINSDHEINPAAATDLVNMYRNMPKIESGKQMYQMLNTGLMLNRTALEAFHRMIKDFYALKKDAKLVVNGAYRTADEQKQISQSSVGKSDHHSGYLVSVRYRTDSGKTTSLPDDYYAWFRDNAYKYGFVIRYPDGKESVTGVSDYNYAFRYVGYAHAYYMHENGLCLEEYISLLQKKYSDSRGTGEHLRITTGDGKIYDIYYVPAPTEITTVPVPKGLTYEMSGTNTNGFVITVERN